MKIGILTFHCAHNYGAVLQAYALKEFLKGKGHEVEILDYRPNYLTDSYKPCLTLDLIKLPIRSFVKNIIIQFVTGKYMRKRYDNFNQFIKVHLNPTPYNSDLKNFDFVFLGSDQIWSKDITGGVFDDNFFAVNAKCKIVSYAASTNITSLSTQDKKYLSNRLRRFSAISVREEAFANLLAETINNDVKCVIDPTFLPCKECYNKIAINPNYDKDYVLVFELNEMPNIRRIGKNIAGQLGCKVIYLTGFPYLRRVYNSMSDISPEQMLGWFKNAKCIVTNSFHGTAFSLIYNKPFYVVRKGNSLDGRMESLLTNIGLISRFINPSDSPIYSEIEYDKINILLNKKVKESKEFIEEALKL